jgi:hypothetical protein
VSALRKCCCSGCCCPPPRSVLRLSAQTFNLELDTGSSDLWFASTACATCPKGTPELDPKKSSTFQTANQNVVLKYGSGTASGITALDTVSMGTFTVNPQIIGANPLLFSNIWLFEWALCSTRSWWRRSTSARPLPSVLTSVLASRGASGTFIQSLRSGNHVLRFANDEHYCSRCRHGVR